MLLAKPATLPIKMLEPPTVNTIDNSWDIVNFGVRLLELETLTKNYRANNL